MKGYQLIEPFFLPELIRQDATLEVCISILCWMVDCLKKEEELKNLPIEIELIKAEYAGAYPCIGIHYLDNSERDWEPEVTAKVEGYFQKPYLSDYYRYLKENSLEIQQNIDKFKASDKA